MDLPIKVNGIVFYEVDNSLKVLVVKRAPDDGNFWQTVTGTLEDGETLENCIKRELAEEAGINAVAEIIPDIYKFHWFKKNGTPINEFVFGIRVDSEPKVVLSHEHDAFEWLSVEDAINRIDPENN